ncbi:hypothetical protein NM688_g492 [Phlebia brevispora]|uniref:Uncharacterized protein n=1 Tax=Phlebia brevispora TaxID=194682 RepID=A0ACC1TE52_9APHY|nr:hypothetical protein NM688_g492 [Phlebia brevispora]
MSPHFRSSITSEPQRSSPEEVYNVICAAASQDPAQIKASSERLKQLLEMAGTFDSLSEIAATRTLPLPVRQQSIIQLKNSSLNHWRSRRLLDPEQRQHIRVRCLALLDEPDDVIAECNEVIVGLRYSMIYLRKLIRRWRRAYAPGVTQPPSIVPLRRALEVLNQILKEFTSMKMLNGVSTTAKIIEQYYMVLQQHYSTAAVPLATLSPISLSDPHTADNILIAHLVFKCLVKTLVWVWPRIIKNNHGFGQLSPWFETLFQNCAVQAQALFDLRTQLVVALRSGAVQAPSGEAARLTELSIRTLTRHVVLFAKFFRRLQQLDATRFVLLPMSSDLILWYWNKVVEATGGPAEYIEDSPTAVFPTRFLVLAMVLFKESLSHWAPERKDKKQNPQVLSKQFVVDAVRMLVLRFIPLKPADLEGWESDPEDWVNHEEQENDLWEYEIRPCAERVLMVITHQYHDYVVPLLYEIFQEIYAKPVTDLESILIREAVYCAIGRTCTRMRTVIPFDAWLETKLIPEAQERNPQYPLIKRRIAWLIGKWMASDCASPNNPKVWELIVWLLKDRGPGTDAVVRLTAAVALKECLDTVSFDIEAFAPYLSIAVEELVRLRSEADTMEMKRRVCTSLNVVIERAELRIVPFMNILTQPLPQLWADADDNWLFKAVLIDSMTKLVEASKEQSVTLSRYVVALVRESFTPAAAAQLDEDGLILWRAALRHTTTLDGVGGDPGLGVLTNLALELLEKNLDLLGKIVGIVKSYVLLDASRLLQDQRYSTALFAALKVGMEQAIPANIKDMAVTLGLVIQLSPSSLWGEPLHNSGLFGYVVKTLEDDKLQTSILTEFVLVLARLVTVDRQMFLQLMAAAPQHIARKTEAELWEGVLNQWWTRFDNMSEPRHRKLTAMGMAGLVSTGRHEVLDRLPTEVCNMWLDVFGELREATTTDDNPTLVLYWDKPTDSYFDESEGSAEYNRLKAVWDNDIVRTTLLTSYVAQCVQEGEIACGGAAVMQSRYLARADETVLDELKKELTGQGVGNKRY